MTAHRGGPARFVALWLLVVAVCGGASWWVIERVGRETGASAWRVPTTSASGTTAAGTAAPVGSNTSAASTSASASANPAPKPSVLPPPDPITTASAPNRPNPPAVTVRSFATPAGTVTASCRGSVIELRSAVPRDGYQVSQHSEDGQLEVKFQGAGDEYEVHVSCRTGTPVRSD